MLLSGISGLVQSFSTSYIMFASMQFVTALVSAGSYMTLFIMFVEMSGPSKRVFAGSLIGVFNSLSQVLIGFVAMFIHNFRTLLQVLYTPMLLLLPFVWIIPESIRWLLSQGHKKQARNIILRAAKMNRKQLSESTMQSLYDSNTITIISSKDMKSAPRVPKQQGGFFVAIRSRALIIRLVNCLFCWFTNAFVYYGLNINSMELAGNKHLNYIFVSLVEIPAILISYCLMNRFGRKYTYISTIFLSGVACICSEFLPIDAAFGRLVLFVIGKCFVNISFTILYLYTSELFPTYLRHSFMNACSTFGSVGSIMAPQTPLLVIIVRR